MTAQHDGGATARVALVTGGSRGIGRAIVGALIEVGWLVAFTYRENLAAAQDVEAAHPERARAFRLDLADRAMPDVVVRDVAASMGPVAALVNNAGVRRDALLAMTSDADWDAVVETNASGAFRCCRAVLPGMISRRQGVIVNVASLSALSGVAGQAAYSASKAAIIGLTRSLARELGKRQIRANAVVPGFVLTDMTTDISPAALQTLRAKECLPAGVTTADVANLVACLLSDRAAAITGQVIAVDAGSSV